MPCSEPCHVACSVRGAWCVVRGVVRDAWCVVCGAWCVVRTCSRVHAQACVEAAESAVGAGACVCVYEHMFET
jgi:hypothetical protein